MLKEHAISTHTPLAGRDPSCAGTVGSSSAISTHTPLAGRDRKSNTTGAVHTEFLLTRPSRDVTMFLPELASKRKKFLLTRPSRDVTFLIPCR